MLGGLLLLVLSIAYLGVQLVVQGEVAEDDGTNAGEALYRLEGKVTDEDASDAGGVLAHDVGLLEMTSR